MDKCWASTHSQCSDKMSREHLVSNGIFEQQKIYVSGLHWCKGEIKEISVASATAKILCSRHNNALSVLDKEGINVVRIFERLFPDNMKSCRSVPTHEIIDGYQFERWLLKTAVNLSYKSEYHIGIGMMDSVAGSPNPYILAVIFGELKLSDGMGLYLIENLVPTAITPGDFNVLPALYEGCIGGFYFHIRGFNFFLSLVPGLVDPNLRNLGFNENSIVPAECLDSKLSYRVTHINSIDNEVAPITLRVKW
ncbi:hypothetical protein L9G16_09855 [Shewanella sp. A25]|nr:hypothetical protein [Shewanella shenzhenensis]